MLNITKKGFFTPIYKNFEQYLNDMIHENYIDFCELWDKKPWDAWVEFESNEYFRCELIDDYLEVVKEDLEEQIEKFLPKTNQK